MALTDLGIGMDQYDRNARLKPALLVILPAALAVVALAPDAVLGWSGGIALILQLGGSFLLAQIVGDIGKTKEPKLFEYCGGRPTELLLSHEHAPNKIVLAERHRKTGQTIPEVQDSDRGSGEERPGGGPGHLHRLRGQDPRHCASRQSKVPGRPP